MVLNDLSDADKADVVLINTCSVREKAEQKLYCRSEGSAMRIRRVARRRTAGRPPGRRNAIKEDPESISSSAHELPRGRHSSRTINGEDGIVDLGEREDEYDWTVADTNTWHSPYVAFLPIIEGRNKFCTYCIAFFPRSRKVCRATRSSAILLS